MSLRLKLTAAFVAGLIAVTATLFLSVMTSRNAAVFRDIAQYAAAQGDLVARVLTGAVRSGDSVTVTSDSLFFPVLAPGLVDRLRAIPGYIVVVDTAGRSVYRSPEIMALRPGDMATLQDQLGDLPKSGEALIFQLDSLGEKLLFVSHAMAGAPGGIGLVASGAVATRATTMPREYIFNALVIVPVILIAAGTAAFVFLGHTQRQLAEITSEVAAITDGRSLHRRLALSEESSDFSDLVTTLNAMIARLETSFGALRRFTADASHELKTPLAVLRADVERAMMTPSQTERMVALEESLQEVRRMTDLVESLLTLARADEGRFDIHREPVELQPLVQEVYETALILGEAQGVAVNLPFTADVVVMADRTRLRQLFLNLVTNAIKYTPSGGKVELGVGRHPDNVTFAVRDTGIGIAAADVPHIFERFWRADRVRSRMSERGGFGLGLAISQWIAQAHGGTLTASSRLGRGSLFTVTLPLPADLQRS
ncbi:MAG TPA: HAMP domain-containing sensor histidine kinase [Gemmatimonadaceae bacterium]|nr:HAMP domain-containing sensor histidine kinase [Gemmatimonadaceae bacterium]